MEILEKLKDQGWHLTEEGLKKLPDNNDLKKIISAALDFDFREIAGGALPPELSKKDESFPGNVVLQVQRIRNISAPKANEESKAAPRFLQIELSDGVTLMQALELEHISVLSMNTPPGTKIHFKCKQVPLMQGMIVMKPVDIQVLGGRVTALVEKWEMTRSLQKYAKSGRQQTGGSGPPPWIAFGQKMQQPVNTDKNFKSLAQAEKEKETGKENDEFNAMRSEAIAEAAKVGGKKIFGGGNHQILDHNVKKILEKGFTEEEAKNALRSTGNSLERALYNLKRRVDDFKNREDFREKFKTVPMGGNKRGGPKEMGGNKRGKEAEVAGTAKPAANVSLFDFLTDKLPSNAEQIPSLSQSSTTTTTTTAAPSFASHSGSSQSYSRPPMTKAGSEPSSTKPYYNSSSNASSYHHDRKQHHQQQQQQQNQDSSSSVKSQDQNSHTSNSNRPKFENNLSSSFATRNSSHPNEERYNRYSNSNRGGRGGSVGGGSGGGSGGNPFHGRPNQPFEESSERHRDQQKNSSGFSSGRGGGGGRGSQHNNNYSGGRGGSSSGGGGGYDNRRYNDYHNQKDQQNQHRHERQDQQHQPQRNGYEQKAAANGKEATTSRYQQQKENSTNYQHNSGNTRNSYDNNRQSGYNSSSNNNNSTNNNNATSHNATHNASNSSNNSNNNDHTARVNKLVESTSKMKIEKTRSGPTARNHQQQQQPHQQPQQQHHQHHQQQNFAQQQQTQQQQQAQQQQQQLQQQHQQQQQQQHHQQQQQQSKQQYQQPPPMNSTTTQKLQQTFGPLPNGFNYDPSKIIGFQAKETNEFALTLLKSQGVPTGPPSHTGANQVPPSAAQQPQFLSGPPPSAMHMAPQPFTTTTYVVPQGVAPPTHSPSAFGMIPGENWNWKIGDRCLAKYWDDGRYYEAEITGISDKTCVVLFLGYGNHEEVLKTDCLPITDAQNRTINFSNNMQHGPPVSVAPQQHQHQQQQQQQQSSMLSRGVPNRYRGERQVYVPPPKRDN